MSRPRTTHTPPHHRPQPLTGQAAKQAVGLSKAAAANGRTGRLGMMASTVGVVESPLEEKTRLSNKVRACFFVWFFFGKGGGVDDGGIGSVDGAFRCFRPR